jgi:hypothetical protein
VDRTTRLTLMVKHGNSCLIPEVGCRESIKKNYRRYIEKIGGSGWVRHINQRHGLPGRDRVGTRSTKASEAANVNAVDRYSASLMFILRVIQLPSLD